MKTVEEIKQERAREENMWESEALGMTEGGGEFYAGDLWLALQDYTDLSKAQFMSRLQRILKRMQAEGSLTSFVRPAPAVRNPSGAQQWLRRYYRAP